MVEGKWLVGDVVMALPVGVVSSEVLRRVEENGGGSVGGEDPGVGVGIRSRPRRGEGVLGRERERIGRLMVLAEWVLVRSSMGEDRGESALWLGPEGYSTRGPSEVGVGLPEAGTESSGVT